MGGRLDFLEATAFKRENIYISCVFVFFFALFFFFFNIFPARTSRRFRGAYTRTPVWAQRDDGFLSLSYTLFLFFFFFCKYIYICICIYIYIFSHIFFFFFFSISSCHRSTRVTQVEVSFSKARETRCASCLGYVFRLHGLNNSAEKIRFRLHEKKETVTLLFLLVLFSFFFFLVLLTGRLFFFFFRNPWYVWASWEPIHLLPNTNSTYVFFFFFFFFF